MIDLHSKIDDLISSEISNLQSEISIIPLLRTYVDLI